MVKTQTVPQISPQCRLWIDNQFVSAESGKTFGTLNPATKELLSEVPAGNAADIDRAVKAARRALEQGDWPRMTARKRGAILLKMAGLLRERADELSYIETLDSGKPISHSRQIDIPSAASACEYFAGWVDKLGGETLPLTSDFFSYTLREPLGVVGIITPWNFPLSIACQKTVAALAAGNTVVLKPAEQTPLTALKLAEIARDAGLPQGVLNVVTGLGEEAGAALVRHPDVNGISFTGEYLTGQEIMRNAAATLKPVSFELGGKSPNIIFADADLDQAADFACDGIFFNQGEVCCAGSRLFVEEKIRGPFMDKLVKRAADWQPGNPLDPQTQMGALVSEEQWNKVQRAIQGGEQEGASLRMDGRHCGLDKGFFVGPTIFERVSNNMKLAQEEIFGPVLAQISFKDFDEVLEQANQTFYGLAAAVWTRDLRKAHRAAKALKAGTVWINCYGQGNHAMPFGGYKMSGSGREGGIHTFDFYTQIKSVWVQL